MKYLRDQQAKRVMVMRKGRNNRTYVRSVQDKVFDDDFWWANEHDIFFAAKGSKDVHSDQFKMSKKDGIISSVARGQSLYKQRYDDVWDVPVRKRDEKF